MVLFEILDIRNICILNFEEINEISLMHIKLKLNSVFSWVIPRQTEIKNK